MKFKMILVAALALVLASCGGGTGAKTPAKTQSVKSSFKAFEVFQRVPSLLKAGVRLQADPEAYNCSTGSIEFSGQDTDSSSSVTLRTPAGGCTMSGDGESVTISTNGADFTITFTFTGDLETGSFEYRMQFNGTLSIGGTGIPTESITYNNLAISFGFTSDGNGRITVTGSVSTPEDGLQTFNGETWTFDEIGE